MFSLEAEVCNWFGCWVWVGSRAWCWETVGLVLVVLWDCGALGLSGFFSLACLSMGALDLWAMGLSCLAVVVRGGPGVLGHGAGSGVRFSVLISWGPRTNKQYLLGVHIRVDTLFLALST